MEKCWKYALTCDLTFANKDCRVKALLKTSTNMETFNRTAARDKEVTNAGEGFALTLGYLQF